jgi:four helix bundle protein
MAPAGMAAFASLGPSGQALSFAHAQLSASLIGRPSLRSAAAQRGPQLRSGQLSASLGGMGIARIQASIMPREHENLAAWQRADDLFIAVHRLTHQQLPRYERYELGSQLRRAAYSVAANIVEGTARRQDGDRRRFYEIADASLRELGYGLHAAHRLGYLPAAALTDFDRRIGFIGAPLRGLIAKYSVRAERSTPIPRTK